MCITLESLLVEQDTPFSEEDLEITAFEMADAIQELQELSNVITTYEAATQCKVACESLNNAAIFKAAVEVQLESFKVAAANAWQKFLDFWKNLFKKIVEFFRNDEKFYKKNRDRIDAGLKKINENKSIGDAIKIRVNYGRSEGDDHNSAYYHRILLQKSLEKRFAIVYDLIQHHDTEYYKDYSLDDFQKLDGDYDWEANHVIKSEETLSDAVFGESSYSDVVWAYVVVKPKYDKLNKYFTEEINRWIDVISKDHDVSINNVRNDTGTVGCLSRIVKNLYKTFMMIREDIMTVSVALIKVAK